MIITLFNNAKSFGDTILTPILKILQIRILMISNIICPKLNQLLHDSFKTNFLLFPLHSDAFLLMYENNF